MSQKQIEKPGQQERSAEVAEPKDLSNKELSKKTDEITEEIDNLLEDVLGEGSAQDFVSAYIQRGGE